MLLVTYCFHLGNRQIQRAYDAPNARCGFMKRVLLFWLLLAFGISIFAASCRDEDDAEYWLDQMYDRPWREKSLKTLIDKTGAVVWRADYQPFGAVDIQTQVVQNSLRFPGQYFDEETGLHYNWHRHYDSIAGRYLTPDPIGIKGGLNLLAYVMNSPLNDSDLSGLRPAGIDGILLPGAFNEGGSWIPETITRDISECGPSREILKELIC